MRLITILGAASALVFAVYPSAAASIEESRADERSFTFRVATPPVESTWEDGGFSSLKIEGFRTHLAQPGAPDVPSRTVLVAIPPGSVPRLSIRLTGSRIARDLKPRPAAQERVVREMPLSQLGTLEARPEEAVELAYEADAAEYEGTGSFPERVAWLGEIGALRAQRYVEVHLAPVRYDRRARQLLVDSGLEITVHFDGPRVRRGTVDAGDRFESVYRESFVNYSQGREFRIDPVLDLPESGLTPMAETVVGAPIRRIRVSANGPVRLDQAFITAQAPELAATDPRKWRLMNRGQQVPLQLVGDGDASLEPGEYVQFYGQAVDNEPDTVLSYDKPSNPIENLYEARDFTDVNAYFLTVEAANQPTMGVRDATPPAGSPKTSYTATAHAEVDDASIFVPLPAELLFWTPFQSETSATRVENVDLPGLVSGTLPIQARVSVRGFIDCSAVAPDHKTEVTLQNNAGQTLTLPAGPNNVGNTNVGIFDGNTLFLHDFAWTNSGGLPVTNPLKVTLKAPTVTGSCPGSAISLTNDNVLNWIEIDYQHSFASIGNSLTFDYNNETAIFEVTGFTSNAIDVYEVTKKLGTSGVIDTVRLTGVTVSQTSPGVYKARFRIDADGTLPAKRRFIAQAGASAPAPANFKLDRVSTVASDTTQADLVVIAHPSLIESTCSVGGNACSYDVDCQASLSDRCEVTTGSPLDLLLQAREARGIATRVVRIGDLEDEFNNGLPGPDAVRNFLIWVMGPSGWQSPKPAYVLLLGDASWDYKGGEANGNFVSTPIMVKNGLASSASILPHFSSDNSLATVIGGDHLADLVVGRLSARHASELDNMLDKLLDLEAPAAGAWQSRVQFISDRGKNYDVSEAAGFQAMNDLGASFVKPPYSVAQLKYWYDNCAQNKNTCNPAAMKQGIKDAVNGVVGPGTAMVQFAGHGNADLWSDDVIFCANPDSPFCVADDTQDLNNFAKLPWLIVHNCLTGAFDSAVSEKSFGEQWLKRVGGGAFAAFAPSGLGFQFIGEDVTEEVWGGVFGEHKQRMLAEPIMASLVRLCIQGSIEPCEYYTLLGDPTSKIALPDIGPPENVVATPSSGPVASVSLDWDASTTVGAKYDVYRRVRTTGVLAYGKVNASPISASAYVDTSVEHAKMYEYYVVAVSNGFESAWSNFNTDCGEVPGPDCVQAKPLNLVPPGAPTGVVATDTETGGRIDVSWNPNLEVDIASYTVHYWSAESPEQTVVVPFGTTISITGLTDGEEYFFAVEAKNTSGTESPLSTPASAIPHFVQGLKAPGFIADLLLAKSSTNPTNLILTWGPVTKDIYGKPKTIAYYEVFRSTNIAFVPSISNRIAAVVSATYTDVNALGAGKPSYYYLVRAVDTAGVAGGAGLQLPAGANDLKIEKVKVNNVPNGHILLKWSPVTKDFDNHATVITHYQVFASNLPFTREDIEAGSIPAIFPSVTQTMVDITPPAGAQFYSVLAVDARGNRSPF